MGTFWQLVITLFVFGFLMNLSQTVFLLVTKKVMNPVQSPLVGFLFFSTGVAFCLLYLSAFSRFIMWLIGR